MKKLIKITGDESSVLSVDLEKVLMQISEKDKGFWKLLWIDGMVINNKLLKKKKFQSVEDFEQSVNKSKDGIFVTIDELIEIAAFSSQILNLLIINSNFKAKLKRYDSDEEMINNCSTVIELIDGSYWEIHSTDKLFADKLLKNLEGSTLI